MSIMVFLPKDSKLHCANHPMPLSWLTNIVLNVWDEKNNRIQNRVLLLSLNKRKATKYKPG